MLSGHPVKKLNVIEALEYFPEITFSQWYKFRSSTLYHNIFCDIKEKNFKMNAHLSFVWFNN